MPKKIIGKQNNFFIIFSKIKLWNFTKYKTYRYKLASVLRVSLVVVTDNLMKTWKILNHVIHKSKRKTLLMKLLIIILYDR